MILRTWDLAKQLRAERRPIAALRHNQLRLLTPGNRQLIQDRFGASVLDIYGTFETDNIAYQCSPHSAYHIAVDSVIVEVLHDGGRQGEAMGDLVVTVLHNRTSPLIRYKLGDQVRLLSDPCPCGRSFPLLEIAAGRNDDLIRSAGGVERSPMPTLTKLDRLVDLIAEYQLAQIGLNEFEVRVVTTISPLSIVDAVRLQNSGARVRVRPVSRIPRTSANKLKAFVNEMPRRPEMSWSAYDAYRKSSTDRRPS